jgi:hypothetical protein
MAATHTAMASGEEPPSDEALDAQFMLLQLLGKGSYGSVYMGQARDSGQLFAIKVITLAEGVRAERSACARLVAGASRPACSHRTRATARFGTRYRCSRRVSVHSNPRLGEERGH